MMKFKSVARHNNESGVMIGIGISEGNVAKLKQDMPIIVDLNEMGIVTEEVRFVSIFYGETDQALFDMVQGKMGAHAKIELREQKKAHEG